MGSNTVITITTPKTVEADDVNQLITALKSDFMPRNATTGAIEGSVHSLGSLAVPWLNTFTDNLYINGTLFDPDNVGTGTDANNAIVSGATRSGSGQPDFIRASGSGASCTILATTTNLQITANGTSVTVTSDIAVSSLTTAPGTNNTCTVNDATLSGQEAAKYKGEHESDPLTISSAGTEITDRIGQYVCLKGTTEYMLAFVESATTLRNVYRGFFFDSSGNPIVREALSNSDTLTIMSLGWVFLQNDGVTVDVSYTSPIYAYTEPSSPATDDYWFDLNARVWKRYSGSAFVTIERMLIGVVVIDGTNCVASRSFDFTKSFSDFISMEAELESVTVARSKAARSAISVYGQVQEYLAHPVQWDITADLESGLTEANSTLYYLYITEDGAPKIATERPYNRVSDLKGWYHPYHTWRYIGLAFNNGSGDIDFVDSINDGSGRFESYTSTTTFYPLPNKKMKVTVIGGGGGGGGSGANGSSGGTTSFGSFLSATGGSGGTQDSSATSAGGAGGAGSSGDVNIAGGSGGAGFASGSAALSGKGGDSFIASGGNSSSSSSGTANGIAGYSYGAGGSGYSNGTGGVAAGGGGSGGAAIKTIDHAVYSVAVAVGSGGSGGSSGGGNGAQGLVIVEYI